ncbi:MAG: hypothetical protein ACLFTE_09590, partial [Salinivenus sp.]
MGKYVLLLTFAALLGATYFTQSMNQTSNAASEDQAERQEEVLARQVARSAFSDGMSDVKRNFDDITDGETRRGTYEDGTYDLSFAVSKTGDGEREVTVTARGTYPAEAEAGSRQATYYLSGTATRRGSVSSVFNAVTSAGEAEFEINGPGCSGGPCVSGIDAGDGDDRHGISMPELENPGEEEDEICETFSQKVVGKESGCDVKSRGQATDEWVQKEFEQVWKAVETLIKEDS